MINKTFVSNQKGRLIEIRVDKKSGWITFHYPQEGGREFYSIPIADWLSDLTNRLDREDNWLNHMMEKTWFGEPMKQFISQSVK